MWLNKYYLSHRHMDKLTYKDLQKKQGDMIHMKFYDSLQVFATLWPPASQIKKRPLLGVSRPCEKKV